MSAISPLTSDVSRRDVAYLFFKRKNQVLAVLGASLLFATVGAYLSPRAYRASATVYVVRNLPPIAATGPSSFNAILDRREVLNSEVDLITSRALAERVAGELGLLDAGAADRPEPSWPVRVLRAGPAAVRAMLLAIGLIDPPESRTEGVVTGLQQGLKATPALNSNFITLSFEAENPEFAARAVNTYTKVYLTQRLGLLKRPGLEAFYDEQIARARVTINEIDDQMTALKNRSGVVSADDQLKLSLEEQSTVSSALREIQSAKQELGQRIALLQQRLKEQPESVVSARVVQRNPNLLALEQRRLELEAERAVELNRFAPGSPAILEFDRSIERIKEAMAREPQTVVNSESSGVNGVRSTLLTDLYRAESDLSAAVAREKELLGRLGDAAGQVRRLDSDAAELRRLSEASANALRIYDTYLRQKEEARIATATDPQVTNVQVVTPGSVPGRPVSPRILEIALGAVLGLVLGIGAAFAGEIFGQTLDRRDDVERELELPVLASIPYIKSGGERLRLG